MTLPSPYIRDRIDLSRQKGLVEKTNIEQDSKFWIQLLQHDIHY